MGLSNLLLPDQQRETVTAFFEARAAAVDACQAGVRESIAFLAEDVLRPNGGHPNADLTHIGRVIATVAWSDMSSAFSLWCQRMVLEYLTWAAPGAEPPAAHIAALGQGAWLGSTALASAMAHYLTEAPLPITARRDGSSYLLSGRVHWASNLMPPDFVMVTAAARADDGQPLIVAIRGDAPGLAIQPYPTLLALQATFSSSVLLEDVRVGDDCVITDDFMAFITGVRPTFLLLQSCFCWGLARRALDQARGGLTGINAVLEPDLVSLEAEATRLATTIADGLRDRREPLPMRTAVQVRLDSARLATGAVALEAKAMGGRGYVNSCATARRLREAAFLPIQAPTEGQLRWELSRSA